MLPGYPGAPQQEGRYVAQRAFYNKFKSMHGVKNLVYLLPNGLAGATFGPVSHWQNDNHVVDWSGRDAFLLVFQVAIVYQAGKVYLFYCDDGFGSLWSCLRTWHRPLVGDQMVLCGVA